MGTTLTASATNSLNKTDRPKERCTITVFAMLGRVGEAGIDQSGLSVIPSISIRFISYPGHQPLTKPKKEKNNQTHGIEINK